MPVSDAFFFSDVCFLGCCYSVTLLRFFVLKEMAIPKFSVLDETKKKKKKKKTIEKLSQFLETFL